MMKLRVRLVGLVGGGLVSNHIVHVFRISEVEEA